MVNRDLVNHVFDRMAAIWGVARFNSQFGGADTLAAAKREWAEFISAYTIREIDGALNACRLGVLAGNDLYRYPSVSIVLQEAASAKNSAVKSIEQKPAISQEQKARNSAIIAELIKDLNI